MVSRMQFVFSKTNLISMRQIITPLLAITIFVSACSKQDRAEESVAMNEQGTLRIAQETGTLYGRYNGTFDRNSRDSVPVSLLFRDDGTYEGSTNGKDYPAICSGTFQVSGSTLIVDDQCTWDSNVDPSLIFDGTWNITFIDERQVRIWRTNGTVTDEYILGRVLR